MDHSRYLTKQTKRRPQILPAPILEWEQVMSQPSQRRRFNGQQTIVESCFMVRNSCLKFWRTQNHFPPCRMRPSYRPENSLIYNHLGTQALHHDLAALREQCLQLKHATSCGDRCDTSSFESNFPGVHGAQHNIQGFDGDFGIDHRQGDNTRRRIFPTAVE